MPKAPQIAAVLVAAGRGLRAGGALPKQWQMVGGKTVAQCSLDALATHPGLSRIALVLHPEDIAAGRGQALIASLPEGAPQTLITPGGDSRAASVRAGLEALADTTPELVLIHDAARPFVSPALIDRVIDALHSHPCAAPALEVTDALWRGGETVTGTQDRAGLWRAQTPQGFHFAPILAAHRANMDPEAADDVAIARAAGLSVAITPGEEANFKLTRPEDFARAERQVLQMDIRLGNGYDVHRFGPGDHVVLCGVRIPHERALQGHSDADVGMHALTDAIYGALAEGDIGRHFPPTDPQWKGADSRIFLAHAGDLARARGFELSNADVTLICERPKVGPHAEAMMQALADILAIEKTRISVKATTSERLGFTGREEGIAAIATATLIAR